MLLTISIVCVLFIFTVSGVSADIPSERYVFQPNEKYRQWTCSNYTCTKSRHPSENTKNLLSLETCRKICTDRPIWPQPKYVKYTLNSYSPFLKRNIQHNIEAPPRTTTQLNKYIEIFKGNLKENDNFEVGNVLKINIKVLNTSDIVELELGVNESYKLTVNIGVAINATITAGTYFGAKHGLESLSQLIWFDPYTGRYQILNDLVIKDYPSFTYRGVMVDTSRNFFPLELLRKTIDGISYSKLNTLHLHLTDSVSFPLVIEDLEWLAEGGAYNNESFYTQKDMADLIEYGSIRGVKVLLEIDAPSHVSAGWHYNSNYTDLVICDDPDILGGQLNPDNEQSLNVLQKIYQNLLQLMKNDNIFHIGGDEVNLDCWKKSKAAQNYTDMTQFWARYTNLMLDRLKRANLNKFPKNVILWSSPLTQSNIAIDTLEHKENLVVQFWFGYPDNFLNHNIRAIFSTVGHWYLDCGFGPWKPSQNHGSCDPFTPWQNFYTYRPWDNSHTKELTEGGEVCLWAEEVAEESLETRIWPRAAAFAERIWSDPLGFEDNVYKRLDNFREILRYRGLQVSAIWPKWCTMNPGSCN